MIGSSSSAAGGASVTSPLMMLGGSGGLHHLHHTGSSAASQYLSRLLDVQQMDVQSALDQMRHLLSTRPQVVYKTCYYRKQTKNFWARDDPAFCALQGVFLVISVVAYSVAFRISLGGFVSFLLYTLLWNWLGMGILIATVCREIANRHLMAHHQSSSHVRQQVEWLYAFDIHCNSFFPVFVLLCTFTSFLQSLLNEQMASARGAGRLRWLAGLISYPCFPHLSRKKRPSTLSFCRCQFWISLLTASFLDAVQFFLIPVVLGEGWIPLVVANGLYAAALSWYWYITHLGYRTLPFLVNTEVFLFPIAAILLLFAIMLVGYPFNFGWNAARVMARFYFT
jgi:hypothetical protein